MKHAMKAIGFAALLMFMQMQDPANAISGIRLTTVDLTGHSHLKMTDSGGVPSETRTSGTSLTYGYGVNGVMFILPVPYVEGGFRAGPVELRGNIGYVLAYLEGRAELAIRDIIKKRHIDIFVNYGRHSIIQSGYGYSYGFGIDMNSPGKSRFFRMELGMFEPDDGSDSQIIPRIGIGWRFDKK